MEKIKCLPGSVYSSLRASIFLFDIARVVEELILNSLDAGATKVDICVNVGACYVKVEDNGFGVSREGLALLGQRYATSKISKPSDMDDYTGELGSRGEALSSLSDISLLEVVTRARGRPNAYRKVMKGRNCLFLGIEESRQNDGTTVIVRDLFYNQPVRRRSMQASPKKVLLLVKKCMLHTALVHPTVSFNLIDLESGSELFHTVSSSSPLPLVSSYFGAEVSSCLHDVSYLDRNLKLNGFLSVPCGTGLMKAFQYLYINSRLVCRGPVHKLINSLASGLSSLKYSSGPEFRDTKRQRTHDCPAYLLNLRCPLSSYDLTFEPSKTVVEFKDWTSILSFIEQAVWSSWKQSSEQSFLGNANKQGCGSYIGDEIYKGDVWATSAHLDKKRKQISFDGPSYEAIDDIEFFKMDTDYGFQDDSYKRNNDKSTGINEFSPDTKLFDITPNRWDEEDYKRTGAELTFMKSTCSLNENKSDMWSVPFLTRCGQSLDIYGSNPLSPACRSEIIGELSNQMEGKFHKGDQFRVSFDLMGGGVEKNRLGRLSQHCHDMENTEPIKRSRRCDFSVSSDDSVWFIGQTDSKSFNKDYGNFQASSTLEFDDDALWFDPERLESKNKVNSNNDRYTQVAKDFENRDSSKLKNRRQRSCSAPPFYKSKSKISWSVFSEVLNSKTLDAKCSNGTVDLIVNASQPCGTTQLLTKSIVDETMLKEKESGVESDGIKSRGVPLEDADELEFLNSNSTKWRTRDLLINSSVQKSHMHDGILNISSGILQMTGNSLVPESICRETLQDAKVLLQLDRKFIPATAGDILIVIDQHAADERIRLEELRVKVMSGEGCSITYLDSEQELVLPEIGFQLVQNYGEQIRKWGWICNSHAPCSGSLARNLSLLKKKPSSINLVAVPCILGINLSEKDLLEYLEQLADTDGASSMPPSVLRILNFKACRGAIMFGDPLLPSECSLIVDELKETSLCFQCAHGRPTTAPLVNLAELHRQLAKLQLQTAGQVVTWHGLRQQRPGMARARARLCSSKRFLNGPGPN